MVRLLEKTTFHLEQLNVSFRVRLGTIEETSIEDAHKMMELNYFGTYYPTRHCLAKMKKRGKGIIVITASQAALMGIYGYGAYGAAKFALRGLAETIAMEATHCGVSVSTKGKCSLTSGLNS